MVNTQQLPPDVADTMQSVCRQLGDALGTTLQSVIIYGSAARGDWKATRSDVNVLVVLTEIGRDQLDAIAPVLREAQSRLLIHPLVTSQEELSGAADTYPVLFFGLRRHHVVVMGQKLDIPAVVESHLRLRVEQQLRDFVLNLRTDYLKDREHPKRLAIALEGRANKALAVLEALVYLETQEWSADRQDGARRAAELIGENESRLTSLCATQPRDEKIYTVYEDLMEVCSRLSLYVDGMQLW